MASESAWLEDRGEYLRLRVQVQARASREEVAGPTAEGFLKVRLTAAPVEGRANRRLLKFLAESLDLPARNLEIISGEKSPRKVIRVEGISASSALAHLTGETVSGKLKE